MAHQWTREDLVRIFEYLIEHNVGLTSHPAFRKLLDRDHNLFANQITREANGNIAYRSVDFNLNGLSDEEIWGMIDNSDYNDLIEENAAVAILKMVAKLDLEDENSTQQVKESADN